MHVALTSTSNDNNAAMQQWAPCSPLNDIASSNGRGSTRKNVFFLNAFGPILSIPFHLKLCQYDPCKVSLKKMTPSLPTNPPTSAFFGISDWTSD